MRRHIIRAAVGHAETAADVEVRERVAFALQVDRQIAHQAEGVAEGGEIGDLAADVHMDAGDLDARQARGGGIKFQRPRIRNAELVLRFACRDLGVCFGVDVRVDAHRDARGRTEARRHLAQGFQLRLALDVETVNALGQRIGHFLARLADAGEDDLGGGNARGPCAAQLALGNHVHSGAHARHRRQHGLIGVRLDREADERVLALESVAQHLVMALQRRRRIDIERRADFRGEARQADVFGMKHAASVIEMVHGRVRTAAGQSYRVIGAGNATG